MAKIVKTLYIDGGHCRDVGQLKGYFHNLSQDSAVYEDLLDYSKSGDMESWLEGHGEEELAQKVVAIDKELGIPNT